MKIKLPANYYQQFDKDFNLEFPAEGFGGWKQALLSLDLATTAIVVMHAWDFGKPEQYPGWHRSVEYISRADAICADEFPFLLQVCRQKGMTIYHVVIPANSYYEKYPGYRRAVSLTESANSGSKIMQIEKNETLRELELFRRDYVFPGKHNLDEINQGIEQLDFPELVKPFGNEGVALDSEQLFALCRADGINHLIYSGFAVNGCLWLSPGGMIDMNRHGLLCSVIAQTVTAIENNETVRGEQAKAFALWYVSLLFGFVYNLDEFVAVLCEIGDAADD